MSYNLPLDLNEPEDIDLILKELNEAFPFEPYPEEEMDQLIHRIYKELNKI